MQLKKVAFDAGYADAPYFDELLQSLKNSGIKAVMLDPSCDYGDDTLIASSCRESSSFAEEEDLPLVTFRYFHKGSQCMIEGLDEVDADFLVKMYQRKYKLPWMIAETERLILREFSLADGMDIFPDISNDPEFTKKYIEKMYGFFGYGIWAVELKNTGEIIGRAGLYNRDGFDELEIGYSIEDSYRGNGYAYEACRAVIDAAISRYGQKSLHALIDTDNKSSIGLIEKLGFIKEGTYDGLEKYVIKFDRRI